MSVSENIKTTITESEVKSWSVGRVCEWLEQHRLSELIPLFARHQIDGEVLLTVTEQDMRSPPLNMTVFGQIRKVAKAIERLVGSLTYDEHPLFGASGHETFYRACQSSAAENKVVPI